MQQIELSRLKKKFVDDCCSQARREANNHVRVHCWKEISRTVREGKRSPWPGSPIPTLDALLTILHHTLHKYILHSRKAII